MGITGFTFLLFQIISYEYYTAYRPSKIHQQPIWNYSEPFYNKEITHYPLEEKKDIYTRHLILG